MKRLILILGFLCFFSAREAQATCTAPSGLFDYKISRKANGDHELSYTTAEGVRRTITDKDGLLVAFAVFRSWQTNNPRILPIQDINLLKSSIQRALSLPESGLSQPQIEALKQLQTLLGRQGNLTFAALEPSLTGVFKNFYRPNGDVRGYRVTSSDGVTGNLVLCADNQVRTIIGCGTRVGARDPQCAPHWSDFCGDLGVSLPFDQRTPEARLKLPVKSCHPENLGSNVLVAPADTSGDSSGASAQ